MGVLVDFEDYGFDRRVAFYQNACKGWPLEAILPCSCGEGGKKPLTALGIVVGDGRSMGMKFVSGLERKVGKKNRMFLICMRRPGIEPGAGRWQRPILPLNHQRYEG